MRGSTSAKRVDCPRAPRSRRTTYARALHRACLILGGAAELAGHLGVSDAALRGWLEGRGEPPQMVFLATVEILLLQVEKPGQAS
jgi:hypothetical protein